MRQRTHDCTISTRRLPSEPMMELWSIELNYWLAINGQMIFRRIIFFGAALLRWKFERLSETKTTAHETVPVVANFVRSLFELCVGFCSNFGSVSVRWYRWPTINWRCVPLQSGLRVTISMRAIADGFASVIDIRRCSEHLLVAGESGRIYYTHTHSTNYYHHQQANDSCCLSVYARNVRCITDKQQI